MANYNKPIIVNDYGFYQSRTPGGIINTSTYNIPTNVGTDSRSGVSNPNYKMQIAKGVNASTSYSRTSRNIRPGSFTIVSHSPSYKEERCTYSIAANSGLYSPFSFPGKDVIGDAGSRLTRKLRENVGSTNQLTNLAELRELPKTVAGLTGSAIGLVRSVLTSKKQGKSLKQYASDQWLSWSFGVLPTLGAIDDLVESIQKYKDRKDHSIREYGVSEDSALTRLTYNGGGTSTHSCTVIVRNELNMSCKITAGYRYDLLSSNDYTLAKHLGFDISSVIPTAYELLPFSWLVDYFTTAGNVIEDTFWVNPGKQIYLCQSTRFRIHTETEAVVRRLSPTGVLDFFTSKPFTCESIQFARTPLATVPRSPFRVKTSAEIAHNAVTKLLNLTSILGSKK